MPELTVVAWGQGTSDWLQVLALNFPCPLSPYRPLRLIAFPTNLLTASPHLI